MKISREGNTVRLEQDISGLVTQSAIIHFIEEAIKKITEEISRIYIEEHKEEILNGLDKTQIIKLIELEIVKQFINK